MIAEIKKQIQDSYTKKHNIIFTSDATENKNTSLSEKETIFNTIIQASLNELYNTMQKNKEDKTFWTQFISGAAGLALIFGSSDKKSKKTRDLILIPPKKLKHFLKTFNPMQLNKNADMILEKCGITNYKNVVKGGTCALVLIEVKITILMENIHKD